jgi:hypothetical protein
MSHQSPHVANHRIIRVTAILGGCAALFVNGPAAAVHLVRKVRVSVLVTFFLALSGWEATCAAQMQFPDTPAGHQGAAWLVAFNTGNRETYRDFLQRNFPSRVEHVDEEMGFREMTGRL